MDTALRLGRYSKMSAEFWLNLQTHHDLEVQQARLGKRLEKEVKVRSAAWTGVVTATGGLTGQVKPRIAGCKYPLRHT